MNEYVMDKNEYDNFKKRNFNQMNTFFKSFIMDYKNKIDPKYMQLIKYIYHRIQDSPTPEVSLGDKEYFRKYFHFESFNKDYYYMMWDIDLAKIIIKERKLEPQKVKVSDLMDYVDVEAINPLKLRNVEKSKEFDPVILASYDPVNSAILIDGNHRVYSKRNQPNSSLEVYFINDLLSIECMAGDVFKNLYALHYNVTKIVQYYDPRNSNAHKWNLDNILISFK